MLSPTVAALLNLHVAARSKDTKYYNIWRDVDKHYKHFTSLYARLPAPSVCNFRALVSSTLRMLRTNLGQEFHLLEQSFYLLDESHWLILCVAWFEGNGYSLDQFKPLEQLVFVLHGGIA